MAVKEVQGELDASELKVGIGISRVNEGLTQQLLQSALGTLKEHGASEDRITVIWVPGADEIPLAIDRMAAAGNYDTFLALGCVIHGKTKHADIIATHVSHSLAEIASESKRPVINGVISAENYDQAVERCGINARNRGRHATEAAIEMANLYRMLG